MPPVSTSSVASILTTGEPDFGRLTTTVASAHGNQWPSVLGATEPDKALAAVGGSFAAAMRTDDDRAVLAVDRFGVQTMCYRIDGERLRFAARADELAGSDADIDPQAIFNYLYFHAIPSPRTIFKQVKRVPAGHVARFEAGQMHVAPYWTPRFEEPAGPVSFDALRDEFRALLQEAVRRRVGAGKPACFLSGGTDSSTVAGMMMTTGAGQASTFSIGFEAEGYDEMAFARVAAKHFKTDHHEYYVTPEDLVASIGQVASKHDQPFGNSSVLPAYYCAKVGKDHGVERMLAGDGGDELFGGNSRYAKQRLFDWYQHAPAAVRKGLIEPLLMETSLGRLPLMRKGASYVSQARVPMPARLEMYNLLHRLGVRDVLTPGFIELVDPAEPLRHQQATWDAASTDSALNRTLAFDWRYTLAETDLPKVRSATQLAGVDVAYPMLDDELLRFSMRLPTEYKLKGGQLRWFFKEALRGFLPDEILSKKKQGFGLPFGLWTTRHAGLKRLATESLASLSGRGIVRPKFLTELVEHRLPAHPGYYGEMIWILMMLEQWLQHHAPGYRL